MAAKFYFDRFTRTESAEAFLRSHLLGVVERFCGHRYTIEVRITGEDPSIGEISLESRNASPVHLMVTGSKGEKFFQLVTRLGESLREALQGAVRESAPVAVTVSAAAVRS